MVLIKIIALVYFINFSTLFSQTLYRSSLVIPTDARSIAMGESFVAVRDPIHTLMYNPASFSTNTGLQVTLSVRKGNYYDALNDFAYYNFSAAYTSTIGEFGLLYSQYYQGIMPITTSAYPEGIGEAKVYDHLFLGKYSRSIGKHLTTGFAIKVFNNIIRQTSGPPNSITFETTSLPILLDMGCMYSTSLLPILETITDELILGFSLQNFGTDFRQKVSTNSPEIYTKLPRFTRVGLSYTLTVANNEDNSLNPFSVIISGEYRNALNYSPNGERDFWSYGGEFSLFEILSLRLGGYIQPYRNVFGESKKPSTRFGFGLNIPIEKISLNLPFTLSFDYSNIPLNTSVYNGFGIIPNTSLDVFSLNLKYNKNLLGETESE